MNAAALAPIPQVDSTAKGTKVAPMWSADCLCLRILSFSSSAAELKGDLEASLKCVGASGWTTTKSSVQNLRRNHTFRSVLLLPFSSHLGSVLTLAPMAVRDLPKEV